jgi:hypothetical protein
MDTTSSKVLESIMKLNNVITNMLLAVLAVAVLMLICTLERLYTSSSS